MSDGRSPADSLRNAVDAVADPEHTGENRCLPCTALNALGVAVAAGLLSRRRRSLGLLAAVLGGAAIWLRGYVVPGTPRFAPRLVDPLPIDIGPDHGEGLDSDSLADGVVTVEAAGGEAAGGEPAGGEPAGGEPAEGEPAEGEPAEGEAIGDKKPDRDTEASDAEADEPGLDPGHDAGLAPSEGGADGEGERGDEPVDPEALVATLVDAGVLVDDGETLLLDESFRDALSDRIDALRRGPDEELADRAAALAGPDIEGQVHDGRILLAGGRDAWLSRPIALAETAAAETLRERGVDEAVARRAARPLRAFLDACPVCDGPVRDTTLRNCCGGPGGVSGNPDRPVRACADCDAVVFADRS